MHKEVDELKNISTWMFKKKSYIPWSDKILTFTFDLISNRSPNGYLINWKAQLCAGRDLKNIMYIQIMDTYDQLVRWSTSRMMLIMTCIFELNTHAITFRNSF